LSEVAERMTGKWLNSNPTCLALTSGDSDPTGRCDMRCQRDLADNYPTQRDRGLERIWDAELYVLVAQAGI
jgi:hypothetical protein